MANFYNDIDPYCCKWTRNLIEAGEIPPGDVDQRSIADVDPAELIRYRQCHFFNGVSGWSLALRLAGWPQDRSVWTGSCPCQPYSCAGKQKGVEDARDLWPAFFRLVRECRPGAIFGEQVEGAIGHGWLDRVQGDLEGQGYAVGHCVLGAHSVGAPHIRQRLYWVATRQLGDPDGARLRPWGREIGCVSSSAGKPLFAKRGPTGGIAIATGSGQPGRPGTGRGDWAKTGDGSGLGNSAGDYQQRDTKSAMHWEGEPAGGSSGVGLADASRTGLAGLPIEYARTEREAVERSGWSDFYLVECRDGKSRRVGAGLQPLAHGLPRSLGPGSTREQRMELVAAKANRVGRLRGYGNAICPPLAAEFIRAFMDCQ